MPTPLRRTASRLNAGGGGGGSSSDAAVTINGVPVTYTITIQISAATAANPTVLTSAAHGLSTGQAVTISAATGGWAGLNAAWAATKIDANTFSVPFNGTGLSSLTGTVIGTF